MKTPIIFISMIFISINISFSQVTEQWIQRFTSDSIRNESVSDMYVDSQGNVYVTGSQKSQPPPFSQMIEAVTVKYDAAGNQQWIQNYRSALNDGAFARAVYVDATGNVYVTGESSIYSGGGNKALVVKYSPSGTQQWSYLFSYNTAYNGGFDIVADLTGNVYVTGEYYTGVSFYNNVFLAKFGPTGNLINQTFYNSGSEGGRKISLDGAGKIIIGGYQNDDSTTFLALKYEQNLDFVWAQRWGDGINNQGALDMKIDINSNVILAATGNSTIDYLTVKISPSGIVLWGKAYNSPEGNDICRAVDCDNFGNVYVTGQTGAQGLPLTNKFTTIKYSPGGSQMWIESYNGGSTVDGYIAYDIDVDDSSNVYVTGNRYSNADIATIKYNSSGSLKWAKTYNGSANSSDDAIAVWGDGMGNAYTAGNSLGNATGIDIVTIKYIPSSIGIQNISNEVPDEFSLSQNYPNPFNPTTKIKFEIKSVAGNLLQKVTLKIFSSEGKEIATVYDGKLSPGIYESVFDGNNLSCGNYFYRLTSNGYSVTKVMTLIK